MLKRGCLGTKTLKGTKTLSWVMNIAHFISFRGIANFIGHCEHNIEGTISSEVSN